MTIKIEKGFITVEGSQFDLEELHKALAMLVGVHTNTEATVETPSFKICLRKKKTNLE
jgi:hypothetical protein